MLPRMTFLFYIFIMWNIDVTLSQRCELRRIEILNNIYTLTTIRTFNGITPTAVFYSKENKIRYVLQNTYYEYMKDEASDNFVREAIPKSPSTFSVNSYIGITMRNNINQKIATLNATSDDRIMFKKHDGLVLLIKYPSQDGSGIFGNMYAFNDSDVAIIGQFVVTVWVKEVGDQVVDVAINPSNGDIAVAANGELILLEKNLIDPCPDADCQDKNHALHSVLEDVQTDMIKVFRESLSTMNGNSVSNQEELIAQRDTLQSEVQRLTKDLEDSAQMFEQFIEQMAGETIASNSVDIATRVRRNTDRNSFMCIPKPVFIKHKNAVTQSLQIARNMETIIHNMESNIRGEAAPQIDPRFVGNAGNASSPNRVRL